MTEIIFPWRVEMFGGLLARQNNTVVSRFQTKKTGALLAYLALGDGRVFPRDKLCETIWGKGDPVALRNRLNQAVSTLRRQLETPGSGTARLFVSDHHSLGVAPNSVATDVGEFERLAATAQTLSDPLAKVEALERAAGLYKGEFLEGFDDDWVLPIRRRLHLVHLNVLRELVDLHTAAGRGAAALNTATLIVALEPEDERAHTDLMALLLDAGRIQDVLSQYDELESVLRRTGRVPSLAAERLRELAMEQPKGRELPTAPSAAEPVSREPATTTARPTSRLPVPFTRLIGRERELTTLEKLLTEDRARLVSVIGIGGSGKTRLASEVAHRLQDAYSGHVFFVPIVLTEHKTDAFESITSAVAPGSASESRHNGDAVAATLSQFERSLLVLDNADELDEGALESVSELLARVQGLQILMTGRRVIGLPGETQVTVGPLDVPKDGETRAAVVGQNPSVQLFLQRAQTIRPDFQVTERTAAAIAALCRRLEGLPLSLELAAGWVRTLSPSQMLEQLAKRLDFLASSRRDVSRRHRAIRAVLDSTLDVLPDSLKDAFFRLAVFSGGFDIASAAAVCSDKEARSKIQGLLDTCLIHSTGESEETARFSMLETLKEYAHEQAPIEVLRASADRHARFFFELATAWPGARFTSPDEWLSAVQTDNVNVMQALAWILDKGKADEGGRMAYSLCRYWEAAGSLREGVHWLQRVLKSPDVTPGTHIRCLAGLSRLTWYAGDHDESRTLMKRALADAEAAKDDAALLDALLAHQLVEHNVGNLDEAERLAVKGLKVSESLGDHSAQARWYLRLGNVSMEQRDWPKARERYERALEVGREAGDSTRIAAALVNIGHYGIKTGQPEFAKLALLEALETSRALGFQFATGTALTNLARAECLAGTPERAAAWLAEALSSPIEDSYVARDVLAASAHAGNFLDEPETAAMLLGKTSTMYGSDEVGGLEMESRAESEGKARKALGDKRFDERFLYGRQMSTEGAMKLAQDMAQRHAPGTNTPENAPT